MPPYSGDAHRLRNWEQLYWAMGLLENKCVHLDGHYVHRSPVCREVNKDSLCDFRGLFDFPPSFPPAAFLVRLPMAVALTEATYASRPGS